MNQPRPFLTALCFALFAAVFVSSNVRPAALYCEPVFSVERATLQRLADEARRALYEAGRPQRGD